MNTPSYQKTAGILSITGGLTAIVGIYLFNGAANFDTTVFKNPRILLGRTDLDATLLKWSMIANMFGYYLLMLPAVFNFHQYLKTKTAWNWLLGWSGATYVFMGAAGAAILSVVWQASIIEYPVATAAQQEIILRHFQLSGQLFYGGIWNTLEMVLAGIFWLGLGLVVKEESPSFGWTTIILGCAYLLSGVGNITAGNVMSDTGINVFLLLPVAWQIWAGIILVSKNKEPNYSPSHKRFALPKFGIAS